MANTHYASLCTKRTRLQQPCPLAPQTFCATTSNSFDLRHTVVKACRVCVPLPCTDCSF